MRRAEPVTYRAGQAGTARGVDADPITTEVIRHGLNSAANQMKRALVRTSFSPIIYEVLDFAAAIYDPDFRMLSQAPSLPFFMGTMSFCVEAAVESVGGREHLDEGDVILVNDPYKTGSHPQDAAIVKPVFLGEELIGFSAIKAHWMDIGAKALYCTDTTDVYQEGTIFPGVKLFRKGVLQEDIIAIARANSRMPVYVLGDINAQITGVEAGAAALVRLVERHGLERFRDSVERMYDHGEAVVRSFLERIPDGRYVGRGEMDSDGISEEPIPFEVVLEVEGSTVRLDFTNVPDARPGPVNCPIASTVSAARIVMTMLAGGGESPNEGHFRPVEVTAVPGSMFHCLAPSPCFLYGWPAMQATEAVLNAVAKAMPDDVVACSGGDLAAVVWWGVREGTGEFWGDGSPHPVGQGASSRGDGGNAMLHLIEAATRFSPAEVWEHRNPWLIERWELAADSGGAGRFRGGLGPDMHFRMLEDAACTSTIERTKNAPWGLAGGGEGRANSGTLRLPDGTSMPVSKATGLPLPKGSVFEIHGGGGGGYGDAAERDPAAVHADLADGYVTEDAARASLAARVRGGCGQVSGAGAVTYRAGVRAPDGSAAAAADPITTEVIRHGLNSAANQMKRALIRAAFTPIIYEVLDFAAVLYDREFRMLAQAPSLPFFMGTMSFCVEGAVQAVGGVEALDEGDRILINDPYVTGSHPADAAIVQPVMVDGELVGFAAIKAHWMDIGAKAPYCTDTTDVFQEGTIFPGVKLYRRGVRQEDIVAIARANSRMPTYVIGDLNAQVAAVEVGAEALARLVRRHGPERFWPAVERMYDHGEAVVRAFLERLPDGRYVGHGELDSDGVTDDPVPFSVALEVEGSTVRLDFSDAPPAVQGPMNCPIASTVSAARVVMTLLAGGGEAPNEGHFRPVEVTAVPGSLFHCLPPSPCFLYGWPAMQATEVVMQAVAEAMPDDVVACSGGDLCAALWSTARARRPASSGATARRTPSGRAPRAAATAATRCCTSSRRPRASRPPRSGSTGTRGSSSATSSPPTRAGRAATAAASGPRSRSACSRTASAWPASSARRTPRGASPAAAPRGRTQASSSWPMAPARPSRRQRASRSRRAPSSTCAAAAGAATATRPSARRRPSTRTWPTAT